MAYKSSPRGDRPVSLIGVHSAEGARTARSLAAFFWDDDTQASSHVGIDATETLPYVPYDRAAWTMRKANPISDNAEVCGFARWTRAQWLSTGVVDGVTNPRAMLDRLADWIRDRCRARGIPTAKLTVRQLADGHWGVIAHADWTFASTAIYGAQDGTHTDPGTNFPWDYVMNRVQGADDMQADEREALFMLRDQLRAPTHWQVQNGWLASSFSYANTLLPQILSAVTALANGSIDQETVVTRMVQASRDATQAAIADILTPGLTELKDLIDKDNAEQARMAADALIDRLASLQGTDPQPAGAGPLPTVDMTTRPR